MDSGAKYDITNWNSLNDVHRCEEIYGGHCCAYRALREWIVFEKIFNLELANTKHIYLAKTQNAYNLFV